MKHPLDDEIDVLARAFREETAEAPRGDRTLAAILRGPVPRTSPTWLAAAAALVFLIAAPTAWAFFGGRLDAWLAPPPAPPAAPTPPVVPAPSLDLAAAPPPPIEEPPIAAPAPLAPPAPPRERSAPERPERVATSERVASPERLAYEEAHALHFDARTPGPALEAWDAYLARYPRGRFALEARYNRALALVRLGRRAEAREALVPFAAGEHGDYRRSEASSLLEALDR